MMKVIGITGGAGSGKSEVLKLMQVVYDAHLIIADDVARFLSSKGQICYNNIVGAFGEDILQPDGEIDRKKLASIVFNDAEKLELLNSLTHPVVHDTIMNDIKTHKEAGDCGCIVIEAALLIETGYKSICDEIWYVYTDAEIRRTRMKETRGYSDEKVDAVMKSQLSDDEFKANSDRVIVNNTTIEAIESQLYDLKSYVFD